MLKIPDFIRLLFLFHFIKHRTHSQFSNYLYKHVLTVLNLPFLFAIVFVSLLFWTKDITIIS